jgi:hypothetical protein
MDPVSGGALPLAPALVGGRRRKLKLVTKKKARKVLKKLGLKMRGGMAAAPESAPVALPKEAVDAAKVGGADEMPEMPATAGRRRGGKKTRRHSRRSIFGY